MIFARRVCLLALASTLALSPVVHAQPALPGVQASSAPATATGVLPSKDAEQLLPNAILFKGQLAPVQARNSGVLRQADGSLVVAALVDNSGYSSGVRERFQFFLYTEVPLQFGGRTLPPGFYGAGFAANNTMTVLDVSGKDVLTAPTKTDPALKRPRPLELLAGSTGGTPRLYLGHAYVEVVAAH